MTEIPAELTQEVGGAIVNTRSAVAARERARARKAQVMAAHRERNERIEANVLKYFEHSEVEVGLAKQLAQVRDQLSVVITTLRANNLTVSEVAELLEVPEAAVRKSRVKVTPSSASNAPPTPRLDRHHAHRGEER